ncbi:MAG: FHA domain-containing protein [Cystobacterineae bacterium]|nr:FHA domain-containing protein [Cystobacterineae bacterium]
MPFLVIYHTDGTEEEWEVVGQLTLGRLDGNDIVLTEEGVSRRHARFFLEGEELWVEDLGSANGTLVNEEVISSPVCLEDKAQVVIGDCEIVVRLDKPAEKEENTQPKAVVISQEDTMGPLRLDAISKKQAVLICVGKPAEGKRFELVGTSVVGRMAGCEIQIEDVSMSRQHAEVVVHEDGSIWLTDLGSANGTSVNGEAVHEATSLSNGDVVCFGTVEMRLQMDGAQVAQKPSRRNALAKRPERPLAASRAASRAVSRYEEKEAAEEEAEAVAVERAPRSKKTLFVVAGIVVVCLLVAVALKLKLSSSPPPPPPRPPVDRTAPPSRDSEAIEVEKAVRQCRQYLHVLDYARAAEACDRARAIDPINKEVNDLIQLITVETECARYFEQGKQALEFEPEKALDLFSEIDESCREYRRQAAELSEVVKKKVEERAKKDCQDYSKAKKWDWAYKRCGVYMDLICPRMPDAELYVPIGYTLVLSPGKLKPKQWRPENEFYRHFLVARSQVDPRGPEWRCKERILEDIRPGTIDPTEQVKEWLAKRLKQKDFEQAIFFYYEGKTKEALGKLAAVRNNMSQVDLHGEVHRLQVLIRQVDTFFSEGMSHLEKANIKAAAERFQEVLDKDKVLLIGEASEMSESEEKAALDDYLKSFFRKNVLNDMPNKCLGYGEDWRKKNDTKRACQIWKVGHHFNKNNSDLLSALLRYCTNHANELLKRVSNCNELREILEYVVDGDGLRQRVEQLQEDNNCPR